MLNRDWPIVAGVAVFLAAAIGCGFYVIGGGAAPMIAISFAVFCVCVAQALQLAQIARSSIRNEDVNQRLLREHNITVRGQSEAMRKSDFVLNEISELRNDAKRDSALVASGFADLKKAYSSISQEMHSLLTRRPISFDQPHSVSSPALDILPNQSPAAPPPSLIDQLLVSLEPIVDLHSGRTAHYRIHLGLAGEVTENMSHEVLLHHADQTGSRPALDIFVAREAEILLRRLRQRDSGLNIFMPIGSATLASRHDLAQIASDLYRSQDVGNGIIFELPHAMLAGLTEQALEG